MTDKFLIQLGTCLQTKAKTKFKTNVEFASACEVDEKSIRRIFLGEQNISLNILKRICTALDIKMSEVLNEIGE